MRIDLSSVMVDDQTRALKFYTDTLGFLKKLDVPMGEHRWLTVVSPDRPADTQLLLEPMAFAPARPYQKALFEAGIPVTSFATDDIHRDYERMRGLGVVFRSQPTKAGPVTTAIFEDTCGNLIQLHQV